MRQLLKNDRSMSNSLPSSQEMKTFDQCCGIHGAMRWRKGEKHALVTARRRHGKEVVKEGMEEVT